jgi:uncharacterized protein YceH (UPF0502 family)
MEKSILTPDQYPLSLNALVNACNQKSSREPVLSLDQGAVQRAVNDLIERKVIMVQPYGGRVDKYQQRFCNTQFAQIKFSPGEFAVICLLLLRGAQTPGELKARSGRLHEFGDVTEVDAALESLLTRSDGPFVARLAREPRRKDHAWAHLFGGPIESEPRSPAATERGPERATREPERATREPELPHPDAREAVAALEARVAHLEQVLTEIKKSLGID